MTVEQQQSTGNCTALFIACKPSVPVCMNYAAAEFITGAAAVASAVAVAAVAGPSLA